jgi:hypothetical protein
LRRTAYRVSSLIDSKMDVTHLLVLHPQILLESGAPQRSHAEAPPDYLSSQPYACERDVALDDSIRRHNSGSRRPLTGPAANRQPF